MRDFSLKLTLVQESFVVRVRTNQECTEFGLVERIAPSIESDESRGDAVDDEARDVALRRFSREPAGEAAGDAGMDGSTRPDHG